MMDEDMVDLNCRNYFVRTDSEGYISGESSDRSLKNCNRNNSVKGEKAEE
jgi:hypothetical protein